PIVVAYLGLLGSIFSIYSVASVGVKCSNSPAPYSIKSSSICSRSGSLTKNCSDGPSLSHTNSGFSDKYSLISFVIILYFFLCKSLYRACPKLPVLSEYFIPSWFTSDNLHVRFLRSTFTNALP